MSRPLSLVLAGLVAALVGGGLALSRGARADGGAAKKLAYVHVSGRASSARAWYQGAPPTGVPVQDALDRFTGDGYRFVAISSGTPTQVVSSGSSSPTPSDASLDTSFVILLEK